MCRLSPGKQSLPLFPSSKHAKVFSRILSDCPPLGEQNGEHGWNAQYKQGIFNSASDSGWFKTREELAVEGKFNQKVAMLDGIEYLPLFDSPMAQQYNSRAASLGFSGNAARKISKMSIPNEQLVDPGLLPEPAYWVPREEVESRYSDWEYSWLLGFKDVTGVTSIRLASFSIFPFWGVADKYPLIRMPRGAECHVAFLVWANSLIVEFFLRQKMQGLHLTWRLLQEVPFIPPSSLTTRCPVCDPVRRIDWLVSRGAEL